MKQFKRLLSVLLCLAMLCSMLPAMASAETGSSTESAGQLLYKYSDTGLVEMSQFPTSIDTNHDIYFYHGTVDSNEAVTAITSSDPAVVELTSLGAGGYKAYIAGAGTTTLTYTVGGAEYSVDVTIPEDSENPDDSGGPTTLAMTAHQYTSEGTATGTTFPAGMDAFCSNTFFLEFKAGDTTVTSLENDNTEAVQVSESGTTGVMKVEMLAAGTAVLSATVDNVAYMFVITVTESSSAGGDTGSETDKVLILIAGEYIYATGTWTPGTDTYTESFSIEFRDESTDSFQFKIGDKLVTSGLKSSDESIASVVELSAENGVWGIKMHEPGTVTLSAEVDGATYTITVNIVDSGSSDGDSGDTGETTQLHIYDAWFDCWFTTLPAGDGWHGYFTFHAAAEGEKLIPTDIEFTRNDGAISVTVSHAAEDPQEDGLVWVDSLYHIEVQGTGSGTLKVTDGETVYAAEIVVQSSSGGDSGSDIETTNPLTAYGGTLVMADNSWDPDGSSYSGTATVQYSANGTYFFQFKAGDALVTSGLTSGDESVATIGQTPIAETSGVWGVNMQAVGTVTLYVVIDDVTYTFTVNIIDGDSDSGSGGDSGDDSGDQGDTPQTGDLTVYMGNYVSTENGTEWQRLNSGANCGTMLFDGETTFLMEVVADGSAVTADLVNSNPSVAEVRYHDSMPGVWEVAVKGAGEAVFSVIINNVTYKYTLTVVDNSDSGDSGEEDNSGGEGVDPSLPTAKLYLWDAWFTGWFTELHPADNWHGYFTLHAGRDASVKLTVDSYEFVRTEGTMDVTLDLAQTDPGLEGLVWVETMYHVQVSGVGSGTLKVQSGETVYCIDIMTYSERPALPVITLGGVDYTVGIGDANGSSIVFLGQGVNTGCYPGTTLAIVAMSGYGEGTLEEAPAAVYQYITSIEVEVTDFTNLDESGDQTAANCTYTYGTKEHHGALLPTFTVNAEENDFFMSKIAVKVTIKDPETGEETTYSIPNYMNYVEEINIDLEATGITTAAGLNQIFASDEAFLAWMKEKHPEDYERFQLGKEKGLDVNVNLTLPAGIYDDAVVVANVTEYVSIWLRGNWGTERTVLRGLNLVETFKFISHIDFVADPDLTMTFDNETFTCGILLARDETGKDFARTYSMDDCSFTGFDYAVRCTDSGLGMTLNGCRIVECGVGFYMDSYERDGGPWAGSIENTLFMNNETAVQIVSLPQYLSPYNFRVNDCDFISNGIDFDVDNPGIFYFYRNYYGGFIDPSGELSVDNVQYRTALAQYDFAENGTIVVTNPRRIAPCTFGPEDDRLCIDPTPGLYTVILNGMADELVIDSESLEDMEEETEITVSDEKEKEMGKWKFKDKKGHK